jgi:hypothetical protein
MRRLAAPFVITCLLTFCAFNAYAQESQPARRKAPSLTMDNYENGRMMTPSNKSSNPTPLKSGDSLSGNFTPVNAQAVLDKAFMQLAKVKSFRMTFSFAAQNEERETVIETVRPNRLRMRSTGVEMIAVGSDVYTKAYQGPWQKTSNPAMTKSLDQTDFLKLVLSSPGISISGWAVGEEVIAGTPTTIYDMTIEEEGASKKLVSGSIRIWIGTKDDLPRKMEFSMPETLVKINVSYTDFNANIVINAPAM